MFSKPEAGWCKFTFGDFVGAISDVTYEDPLVKLANLIINDEDGIVHCDEEGTDFDIVISNVIVYVVSNRDNKPTLYTINDAYCWYYNFGLELAKDMREIADDWELHMRLFENKSAYLLGLADKLEAECQKRKGYLDEFKI